MKSKYLILIIFSIWVKSSYCQKIEDINSYKYLKVAPLMYQNGGSDIFGIRQIVIDALSESGIQIISNDTQPNDLLENPCLLLSCFISHTNALGVRDYVTIKFKNCKGDLVYETKGRCGLIVSTVEQEFVEAAQSASKPLKKFKYKFDEYKILKFEYPVVEKTNETEQ